MLPQPWPRRPRGAKDPWPRACPRGAGSVASRSLQSKEEALGGAEGRTGGLAAENTLSPFTLSSSRAPNAPRTRRFSSNTS